MTRRWTKHLPALCLLCLVMGCAERTDTSKAPHGQDADATDDRAPRETVSEDTPLVLSPARIRWSDAGARVEVDYRRQEGTVLEALKLEAEGPRRSFDLSSALPVSVLGRINGQPVGTVSFPLAAQYLPAGRYRLVVTPRLVDTGGDGVLAGDGMIYTSESVEPMSDYTFSYRTASLMAGHSAIVRVQGQLPNTPRGWKFYYVTVGREVAIHRTFAKRGKHWERVSEPVRVNADDGDWHRVSITCKGNTISVSVDGTPCGSYTDPDKWYMAGGVGFWQMAPSCIFDDVTVTTLDDNRTILEDHFKGKALADHWAVGSGAWEQTPGKVLLPGRHDLGELEVAQRGPDAGLARVEIRREMDASRLYVNDRPVVPLILAFSSIAKAPDSPESYRLARRAALAGMPILAPSLHNCVKPTADGGLDFTELDTAMTRLAVACPGAWIMPRFSVPKPGSVPADERMEMAHGPDDPYDTLSRRSAMKRFIGASTASSTYRHFVIDHIDEVVEHIRSQPYASRFIGMTVTGGGYEGNWGAPGKPWGTILDVSPAMHRLFGQYLKTKYGTEAACAEAWGRKKVSFNTPPLPGPTERTTATFAGFRDPSSPLGRYMQDFNEFYGSHVAETTLGPLFGKLHELSPTTFWGRFGLFTFSWHRSAVDRLGRYPLIDNPGQRFVVGCLTYGDRLAGGVSVYTNSAWESVRLRGGITIGEADIRTVQGRAGHRREATYYDTLQTMRREFGHAILCKRMGLWYYDMWMGWFDHPIFLAEFNAQAAVARRAHTLPHRNLAQTVIVGDTEGWRHFAGYGEAPLKAAEVPTRPMQKFFESLGRTIVESSMRVGAPRDMIVKRDLWHPDRRDYNLYIFPTTFGADARTRKTIHELATSGKTVFMTWAAGITDETSVGLDNMKHLLGMTVKTDGQHADMTCKTVKADHPLLADLPEGTRLGMTGSRAVRFWIDDEDVTVLARYDDGKAAMAVKKMGAGHMVYSAVPIVQPTFLRNLSDFAGNHLFTEGDDAFYADNHFVVLHSKPGSAGKRTIRLPRRVASVVDLVAGDVVATDTDTLTVELPEKTTGIWYYGDQPERVRGVSLGPAPLEEPEPLKR